MVTVKMEPNLDETIFKNDPLNTVNCMKEESIIKCDPDSLEFVQNVIKDEPMDSLEKEVEGDYKPFDPENSETDVLSPPPVEQEDSLSKNWKTCKICSRRFQFQYLVAIHAPVCLRRKSVANHYEPDPVNPFRCKIEGCPEKFPTPFKLTVHEKTHLTECPICSKKFLRGPDLDAHYLTHTESPLGPFQCDVCLRTFALKSALILHVQIHLDENSQGKKKEKVVKEYKCAICSKVMITAPGYEYHMNAHLGLTPFKCPLCSKSFSSPTNRKEHKRRVHLKGTAVTVKDESEFITGL